MNYPEAIEYLLSFADFERTGRFQERADLAPMRALLHELGDPQDADGYSLTFHVAGSKGKGSTAAMIESIVRAAGHTTGLYTSPHLYEYTERIRLSGDPIEQDEFAALVSDELAPAVERAQFLLRDRTLITFDLLTALGFLAMRGVEYRVIEVGLGGRLDSTNVFDDSEVVVITPLSYEHTAVLGDTIEEIAAEKAGIIRPSSTVVIAPQEYPAAKRVIHDAIAGVVWEGLPQELRSVDVAGEYHWRVLDHDVAGQQIRIDGPLASVEARLPLLGGHQVENAATALAAVEAMDRRVPLYSERSSIVRGLESVRWPGRLEVVQERPLVVVDGAHNGESAQRLVEALREYFGAEGVTFVVGAGSDKNVGALARALAPIATRVFATRADHPRAADPVRIREAFEALGVPAEDVDTVENALSRAMATTEEGGLICLTGSLFVAAEGRTALAAGGN
jgi:dihydrofolate synthase/folylpolyglutamate synthase